MTGPRKRGKFLAMDLQIFRNFIGGRYTEPVSGEYLDNFNPGTGKLYSKIPSSDSRDLDLAFEAATMAQIQWEKSSSAHRAELMNKIADLLEAEIDDFAKAESIDQGKPIHLAKNMDMRRSIENFRYFAQILSQIPAESYEKDHYRSIIQKKPIGVVGLISPWNLPLYLLTWKIAPAIACGNVVICKPSEFTSVTALKFAELTKRAGLPDGVINVLTGLGNKIGEAIVKHPKIPAISFTGGTATGRHIFRQAADNFKKISLELGGKNPNIIFADCDLEKAVDVSLRSSFLNQGEICLCGSRIYLEEKIAEAFIEKFLRRIKRLKVGDPLASDSFMGALISKAHLEKIKSYIELAKKEGGQILIGGTDPADLPEVNRQGYFLLPTVIDGLPQKSSCVQEEIFGPVVSLHRFSSVDEAVTLANDVSYGLSATIWTESPQLAKEVSERLDVGTVWINDWLQRDLNVPFGGMKHSGVGREGGHHSIDFFTEARTVVYRKDFL